MKTAGWAAVALLLATTASADVLKLNGIGECQAGVVKPVPDGTKCTYSYRLGNFACTVTNNNCVLELPSLVGVFDKPEFCCFVASAQSTMSLRVAWIGEGTPPPPPPPPPR